MYFLCSMIFLRTYMSHARMSLLACRIPCDYKDKNLSILMEEDNKSPSNVVRYCRRAIQQKIYPVKLWDILLDSCVDASPLLVVNNGMVNIFIGSHSHLFLCSDGCSGSARCNVKLEGRIECSVAVTGTLICQRKTIRDSTFDEPDSKLFKQQSDGVVEYELCSYFVAFGFPVLRL